MASAKEATDVILVANGGGHTYKPFKNRNLIFGTQAPVLGNSCLPSFIYKNCRSNLASTDCI